MADRHAPRAKGICPECKRVISGRAVGPERDAAARRYVALSPHYRQPGGTVRHPQVCLSRGGRRVVPRLTDAELAALGDSDTEANGEDAAVPGG